jgi:hypothetical protein
MTLQETIHSRVSLLHVRAWQRQRQRAAHWGIVIYTIADLHSRIQSADVTLIIFYSGCNQAHIPACPILFKKSLGLSLLICT